MSASKTIYVVYDGDCPFCSQFVKFVRLREAAGKVELINAREPHPIVERLGKMGIRLNEEMALVMGDEVYTGPDCMNRLALMSTGAGLFNSVNAAIFSSRRVSRLLYPMLRLGRNATLRLLGRSGISSV